jgi:ABC-type phosphate/phosphonate transport system substrate-binding protein
VRAGRIDVGPLDAYWHALIARHAPQLTEGIRVLASTAVAPMPALVASASMPRPIVERLRTALLGAAERKWFGACGERLQIDGFAAVTEGAYSTLLDWEAEARAAGYDKPA